MKYLDKFIMFVTARSLTQIDAAFLFWFGYSLFTEDYLAAALLAALGFVSGLAAKKIRRQACMRKEIK